MFLLQNWWERQFIEVSVGCVKACGANVRGVRNSYDGEQSGFPEGYRPSPQACGRQDIGGDDEWNSFP
jgi:hypothetical protein